MQAQLFCATCTTPLAFKVPELTGNQWHTPCAACGNHTALEPNRTEAEELATLSATGIHSGELIPDGTIARIPKN